MNKQIPKPEPPIIPSKNKCEELGFVHAWADITPNILYLTNPPQYPDKKEQCLNCGLIRIFKHEVMEWIEYEQGAPDQRININTSTS